MDPNNLNEVGVFFENNNENPNVAPVKRPYNKISNEIRQLIVDNLQNETMDIEQLSTAFKVKKCTVISIYNTFKKENRVNKLPKGKRTQKKLSEDDIKMIKDALDENCQSTLEDLKNLVHDRVEKDVSKSTVSRTIGSFHYSFKRIKKITPNAETPQLAEERRTYCTWFLQKQGEGANFIFLDETGFEVYYIIIF